MADIDRTMLLAEITGFLGTDLLCYRADHPDTKALRLKQDAIFDPILARVLQQFGAAFLVTDSIMPVAQNAAVIAALHKEFAAANDTQLLALSELTGLLGSALLTLALWKGWLTIDEALIASRLDEQHAANRYGLDPVIEAKWISQAKNVKAAAEILI